MLEFIKPEIRPYVHVDTTKCTEALSEGKLRGLDGVSSNSFHEQGVAETIIAMGDCRCPCKCTCTCLCECPCPCECKCPCPSEFPAY